MASKKVKGQKLNLAAFVTSTGGSDPDALPTGPSGRHTDERSSGRSAGGRWDKSSEGGGYAGRGGHRRYGDRSDAGDGNGDADADADHYDAGQIDDEAAPSRADEASAWRRAPDPAASSSSGRGDRGNDGSSRYGGGRGDDRSGPRRYGDRDRDSSNSSSMSNRSYADRGDRGDRGDHDAPRDRDTETVSDSVSDWRSSRASTTQSTAFPRDRDRDHDRDRDRDQDHDRDSSSMSSRSSDRTDRNFSRGTSDRSVGSADAEAEWRKFPLRDRDAGASSSGERGEPGSDRYDRGSADRNDRVGDRSGSDRFSIHRSERAGDRDRDTSLSDRRSYAGSGNGGGSNRHSDRDRDRTIPRDYPDRQDVGSGGSGRGGYDRGSYDRDRGDRMDRGEGGRGAFNGAGTGNPGESVTERPARLKNLLKKRGEVGEEGGDEQTEESQQKQLEQDPQRKQHQPASLQETPASASVTASASSTSALNGSTATAETNSGQSENRFAALDRFDRNASITPSATPATSTIRDRVVDDLPPNKVPELAPVKLSSTRKSHSASAAPAIPGRGRLEPNRTERRDSGNTSNSSAAAPTSSSSATAPTSVPITMDSSRYSEDVLKPVLSIKKVNALESAIREKQTVTDQQLSDSLCKLDLSNGILKQNVSVVIAKSIIEGKVSLKTFVSNIKEQTETESGSLLASVLVAYRDRKSDRELSKLVADSGVDVLPLLVASAQDSSARAIDAVLAQHKLLILKPIPEGLNTAISAMLIKGDSDQQIIDYLNTQVSGDIPVLDVTKLIATHIFDQLFSTKPFSVASLSTRAPLLIRVANDSMTRVSIIFAAQVSWHNKGAAAKGLLKDLYSELWKLNIVRAADFVTWRDDLKEKAVGKPKALLQVNAWMKDVEEQAKKEQVKEAQRNGEHEEEEEEEEDDNEDDDEDEADEDEDDDDDYPRRR